MTVNDVSIYKHNNRVITHALTLSSLLCVQCYSKQGRKPNFSSFHFDLNCICNREIFTQSKCSFILVQQTSPFLFFLLLLFFFSLRASCFYPSDELFTCLSGLGLFIFSLCWSSKHSPASAPCQHSLSLCCLLPFSSGLLEVCNPGCDISAWSLTMDVKGAVWVLTQGHASP